LLMDHLEETRQMAICMSRIKPCTMWLPYTTIDHLLKEMEKCVRESPVEKATTIEYQVLIDRLKASLDAYFRVHDQLSDRYQLLSYSTSTHIYT
jgi:hypothetical protein